MSTERKTELTRPTIYPKCDSCEYAKKAEEESLRMFKQVDREIEIDCQESGGGGSHQINPGEWLPFDSRRISAKITCSPDEGKNTEFITAHGGVPKCPHDLEPNKPPKRFLSSWILRKK
ncbi:hypothetical protein KA005_68320 [bacterium]|nr:hypothetical protein [bacterium]